MVDFSQEFHRRERFERMKSLVNQNQQTFLEMALEQLKSSDQKLVFKAKYFQGTYNNPQDGIVVPFVIALPADKKSKLIENILRGEDAVLDAKFFEMIYEGSIKGRISCGSVEFTKCYTTFPPNQTDTSISTYKGSSSDGRTYIGLWNLKTLTHQELAHQEYMAHEGPFRIELVS